MTDLLKAFKLATQYHGNQMYGNKPYIYHLSQVVGVLMKWNATEDEIIAGALHDILEDTGIHWFDLVDACPNTETAAIICDVTDEDGEHRKDRKLKTYAHLINNESALIVKLADRYCNLRYSWKSGNKKKLDMYLKEHQFFVDCLYREYHSVRIQKAWMAVTTLHGSILK